MENILTRALLKEIVPTPMNGKRIHKGIVQLVQNFFFARYSPAELSNERFSIHVSNDSESKVGLVALVTFAERQQSPFKFSITSKTFDSLNADMQALVGELKVPVAEDTGSCELFPFCQSHSVLETLASLFSKEDDGSSPLEQRVPFTRLFFMGNVPEQKIIQQMGVWSEAFVPYERNNNNSEQLDSFLTESTRINYLTCPNVQKATLLLQGRRRETFGLRFQLRPKDSVAQWFATSGCTNKKFTVAFSGGKDSSALILALLAHKAATGDNDMEVEAVTFDPRLPGFDVARI